MTTPPKPEKFRLPDDDDPNEVPTVIAKRPTLPTPAAAPAPAPPPADPGEADGKS